MRFWSVTPRSFSGWKSLGIGFPSGWGSDAVPAGWIMVNLAVRGRRAFLRLQVTAYTGC